jgi:hypothetical protein
MCTHRKSLHQLKDIYADADQTELMKMAVRMPDAKLSAMKSMKMIGHKSKS